MNIEYFQESLELMSYSGAVLLNVEKTALIENSLILLQSNNKLSKIFFWGRITAIDADYYIAFGYSKDCIRGRHFYFTINLHEWYRLPQADPDLYPLCLRAESPFVGDISTIIEVTLVMYYRIILSDVYDFVLFLYQDPKFTIDANGENITPTVPKVRSLKEEDRLACVLEMITEDSALMPRSSLTKQIDGRAVYNQAFRGLSMAEASRMENFQLFRRPQNKWNSNLLKRADYNYNTDIFDTVDCFVPQKYSFVVSVFDDRGLVLVRSLYWPGMTFFHKCQTRKHGFAYFGDGRRNNDLLFML